MFLLLPLLLVVLYFLHPIPLQGTNVDLGHHILLGEIISKSGYVPTTNLLSFTYPNFPFINTHWLADVIFYVVKDIFGFNGLIILSTILAAFIFGILFKVAGTRNKFIAFISLAFYLQILIDRTEVKPELFSLLLLSTFLWILYKFRKSATNLVFLLIPLELLWVNTHIYFVIGILVLGIFTLESIILEKKHLWSNKTKTLLLVTGLSAFITVINPNFIKGAIFPFHFLNNYGYDVIENRNFFSVVMTNGDVTFFYFVLAACILLFGSLYFYKKIPLVDILLSVAFILLSLVAVRNFSLFVVGTFVPFVGIVYLLADKLRIKFGQWWDTTIVPILLISFGILLIPGVVWNFSNHGFGLGVHDNANEAIEYFQTNSLRGPIYNNYNIGNYLEYRLYPSEKVFVDGRPEAYPKEFFQDVYYPTQNSFIGFEKIDHKYKFNTVFYEHKNQTLTENNLLKGLVNSPKWKMVYLNNSIVVFAKNAKSGISSNSATIIGDELTQKSDIGDMSNFYRVIGWYTHMMKMDLKYLEHDPKNCTSLRHVAAVMRQLNDPQAPVYISRFLESCS